KVVALAVNSVVGSGVYLLPAAAAGLLGTGSLLAVAVAAVAVLLVVLCFAEASSRFDATGGPYLYTRVAFGDLVGFQVGWMAWLTRVATAASLSVGLADALSYLLPAAGEGPWRVAAIVLPLLLLTAINVAGVRFGADAAVLLVAGKLVPLLVFVAVGAYHFSGETFAAQQPTQTGGLGAAALLLLFAFAGFENTTAPAGEYRKPKRDVPFALVGQLALVTCLYLAVQAVALGTLPVLGDATSPIAEAAGRFLGGWGGWLLTAGAVVSIAGTLNDSVLAGPRYLYALAQRGFGPAVLSRVDRRFHTPAVAILLQTAVVLPLALTGSFVALAALSVIARLATYIGTSLAVPVLRKKGIGEQPDETDGDDDRGPWRLPGGPTIPIAATAVSLVLLASAGQANLVAGAVALAAGFVVYLLRRR
ncbi:MAG TPA: APC family permease, partial [Thermoanaerobaculia bacterium]|nr:APC family permease [Thermoanaerobaculia bacterium]